MASASTDVTITRKIDWLDGRGVVDMEISDKLAERIIENVARHLGPLGDQPIVADYCDDVIRQMDHLIEQQLCGSLAKNHEWTDQAIVDICKAVMERATTQTDTIDNSSESEESEEEEEVMFPAAAGYLDVVNRASHYMDGLPSTGRAWDLDKAGKTVYLDEVIVTRPWIDGDGQLQRVKISAKLLDRVLNAGTYHGFDLELVDKVILELKYSAIGDIRADASIDNDEILEAWEKIYKGEPYVSRLGKRFPKENLETEQP
jgi:hypothetical protein